MKLTLVLVLLIYVVCVIGFDNNSLFGNSTKLSRAKRYLDFLKSSRLFFRVNIKENVFSWGNLWAHAVGFKANMNILNENKNIRPYRRDTYAVLQELFDLNGLDGKACILKAFCTANRTSDGQLGNGMLFKLLRHIFRPIVFGQDEKLDHSRSKRFVPPLIVFPITAPTRHQLIFGIGIPEGDLDFESLTNGWVLKYEYFLPSNVTQLYVPAQLNIAGRSIPDENKRNEEYDEEAVQIDMGFDSEEPSENSKSEDEFDTDFKSSWELTKNEQKTLSKHRWAFYKALEAAGDRKGFVGRACVLKSICETSRIPFHYQNGIIAELIHIMLTPSTSVDTLSSHSDNEYFQAEVLGKSGARCDAVFKECESSLLDVFTNVLDVSDDLRKIFL